MLAPGVREVAGRLAHEELADGAGARRHAARVQAHGVPPRPLPRLPGAALRARVMGRHASSGATTCLCGAP